MAIFAFAQLVTAPLWGRLSDRVGRRPVIMVGQALSGIAFLVFGLAESVVLLMLCRLVQGAGGGTIGVNQAYVGDVVGPTERAKALGWITACGSAGVMIGPAIASFSVRFSESAPGLIAAAFCGLNVIFTWRWLPEPVRRDRDRTRRRQPILPAIGAVVTRPLAPAHLLIWVYAIAMMGLHGDECRHGVVPRRPLRRRRTVHRLVLRRLGLVFGGHARRHSRHRGAAFR